MLGGSFTYTVCVVYSYICASLIFLELFVMSHFVYYSRNCLPCRRLCNIYKKSRKTPQQVSDPFFLRFIISSSCTIVSLFVFPYKTQKKNEA